jgi:hypothetical protein
MEVVLFYFVENGKNIIPHKRLTTADPEGKNLQFGKSPDKLYPLICCQITRRIARRINVAMLAGEIAPVGNGDEDIQWSRETVVHDKYITPIPLNAISVSSISCLQASGSTSK